MIDNDCTGCFGIEEVAEELLPKIQSRKTQISIETVNGIEETETVASEGLIVRCGAKHASLYPSEQVSLPTTYSCTTLPLSKHEIPTPTNMRHWRYLKAVAKSMPEYDEAIPFGLLIGGNCPKALEPQEVVPSQARLVCRWSHS